MIIKYRLGPVQARNWSHPADDPQINRKNIPGPEMVALALIKEFEWTQEFGQWP